MPDPGSDMPGSGVRIAGSRIPDPGQSVIRNLASVPSPHPRMIAFLRGRVLDKQPNRIIVDVQGVGYELHVPLSTYYDIGEEGSEISLRVHTHVREEALQLYGFLTLLEQQVFERLIAISGIGPKLAIAVLSGHRDARAGGGGPARRCRAPDQRPGDRQEDGGAHRPRAEGPARASGGSLRRRRRRRWRRPGDRLRDDLLSALQNLGYHRPAAEKAVETTLSSSTEPTFEQALRSALRELMR